MTIIQIFLAVIGTPVFLFMIFRIIKEEKMRKKLFSDLEKSNHEHLFNPGSSADVKNEQQLISGSIENLKNASNFISEISAGNLDADWRGLTPENRMLNEKNLAGELIRMRERMKELKTEEAKHLWKTEGEAKFSEIVRTNQHDIQILCDKVVAFVVKYLSAQQGSIFVVQEEEERVFLELKSCYAFDRKKYVEKVIEAGQGLVGQIYKEGTSCMLNEIPQNYVFITSGLGHATPNCLLITPMTYNEKISAIIEIASFQVFEPYQREWLEKVGEIMASTLASITITEKTQKMLKEFQQQTEQLRAQEEELRQNMEEMQATQEELQRNRKHQKEDSFESENC